MLWPAIALNQTHGVVDLEFPQHGSCFFGCWCFSCVQNPFVRCAVLSNARSTDACITRNANLSEAGNLRLLKFFVSEGTLQEMTPFAIIDGFIHTLNNQSVT